MARDLKANFGGRIGFLRFVNTRNWTCVPIGIYISDEEKIKCVSERSVNLYEGSTLS